jgi:mediator of RNA polymerase II transcription subunit 16
MVNVLKIVVDYSEEAHHDQLVRNTYLQSCLSMLSHLGFQGDFKPRPFSAKFAMLALNVRNIVVLITVASNTPVNIKEKLNPLDDPEVVDSLAGCGKWGVDLLAWLADRLFGLLRDPEITAMLEDKNRFPELTRYLQSKKEVSLHLLLCSSTRGFLSAVCRRLMHLETISDRAVQFYELNPQLQHQQQDPVAPSAATARPHPALYQAYLKLRRTVSSSLVKVQEFDNLLSALSKDIQSAYQATFSGLVAAAVKPKQANLTEQQQLQLNQQFIKKAQTHCELDMLLGVSLPPSFRKVLHNFFKVTLPELRKQTDHAQLHFAPYDLLEVQENPNSLAMRKAARKYVDVFRRVELVMGRPPPPKHARDGQESNLLPMKRTANGEEVNNGRGADGPNGNNGNGLEWRRCVRCASVMEDIWANRPGYNFVLAQQRKCACGGSWGVVSRGT